jgi:hypothetical protein
MRVDELELTTFLLLYTLRADHHHQWLYSLCKDPSHTGGFVILLRHSVGLLCASDTRVAKVSFYTGQHSTETQRQTSMPLAGFEPTIPVTARPPGPAVHADNT